MTMMKYGPLPGNTSSLFVQVNVAGDVAPDAVVATAEKDLDSAGAMVTGDGETATLTIVVDSVTVTATVSRPDPDAAMMLTGPPGATAVSSPDDDTLATVELELLHVTTALEQAGLRSAESVVVCPTANVAGVPEMCTSVTEQPAPAAGLHDASTAAVTAVAAM
jgi:hypothetical protein